jgi:hypothetical protein
VSIRTRLALLAAALGVALTAVPAAADASTRAGDRCERRGAVTLEANAAVRIYEISDEQDQHTMFGCRYRTGRTTALASWFDCGCSRADEPTPQVALNGLAAGVNRYSCPPTNDACTGRFTVYNLLTGRRLRQTDTTGAVQAVVTRGGAAAFVTSSRSVTAPTNQLIALDGGGRRVLDPGPNVVYTSLALAGNRVYWMRGDAAQTALLR